MGNATSFCFRLAQQFPGALRNINGRVPDALEIANDLECRRQKSQVACHRLFERQNFVTQSVDLDLELVDGVISTDDFVSQARLPFRERAHGIGNHLLGLVAHEQKLVLQQP